MAYSGWNLKIGNWIFPNKYIKAESFSAYAIMQDVGDFTDANGYLHRDAVELKSLKVDFETKAMFTNNTFEENVMKNIRANYTIPKARQCMITAYVQEFNDYLTQTGYLVDFQPAIYGSYGGENHYKAFRLAFVGGVYDG